eukprot:IDg2877t1
MSKSTVRNVLKKPEASYKHKKASKTEKNAKEIGASDRLEGSCTMLQSSNICENSTKATSKYASTGIYDIKVNGVFEEQKFDNDGPGSFQFYRADIKAETQFLSKRNQAGGIVIFGFVLRCTGWALLLSCAQTWALII